MKTYFGDLPEEGQAFLTKMLRIDYSNCDFKGPKWFSTYVRNSRGRIVGVFATEFVFWFEGRISVAVLDPRCVTRRLLIANYTALFSQAKRLTAEIEPHNRRAIHEAREMGFIYEGYRRLGLEGNRDVLMFGMLKEECIYLPTYTGPTILVPRAPAAHERLH